MCVGGVYEWFCNRTGSYKGGGAKPSISLDILPLCAVGGITVCYGTHLQSPVLWVRSYHQDCIIFGFSFYIQNSAKILVELEIWIFKSDPSLIVDIFLNQDYSADSNGGICVTIPALGDENRNLPCFCLPTLPRKSSWGLGSYYTPLERYS